uniref:Uncharacterized protein n=1 Tax=Myotis myotis TaxID=51298 RepID=A0A7J7Y099_MYOMY|nr:hypothetical protein mMyoMyo1_011480 [Myotis myotis]
MTEASQQRGYEVAAGDGEGKRQEVGWEGGQGQRRKRWAPSASPHVSSFLHTYLSVCLSPFPLPSPSPPGLMKQATLGPLLTPPTSSAPPIHSVPQRGHQKPMTWWISNLRAARAPLGLWGPAPGLPQIRVWRQSREWPKDSLPSTRPEALAGADCALGVLSPVHSPQKVATFMLTWQRKKLRH